MKWKWFAMLGLYAGFSGAMYADPLNYTWTTPGSGTLDGVAFSDSGVEPFITQHTIVFTLTADSASAFQTSPGSFEVRGPTTVTVAGVGTDTITDSIDIYESYDGLFTYFGLQDTTNGSGFNIAARGGCFAGCTQTDDLAGPYGPVNGRGNPASGTFDTTRGALVFTGPGAPFYTTPTLQITKAPSAVTPEPSSLVLLGTGVLGLVGVMRRRSWALRVR